MRCFLSSVAACKYQIPDTPMLAGLAWRLLILTWNLGLRCLEVRPGEGCEGRCCRMISTRCNLLPSGWCTNRSHITVSATSTMSAEISCRHFLYVHWACTVDESFCMFIVVYKLQRCAAQIEGKQQDQTYLLVASHSQQPLDITAIRVSL